MPLKHSLQGFNIQFVFHHSEKTQKNHKMCSKITTRLFFPLLIHWLSIPDLQMTFLLRWIAVIDFLNQLYYLRLTQSRRGRTAINILIFSVENC